MKSYLLVSLVAVIGFTIGCLWGGPLVGGVTVVSSLFWYFAK